MKPKIALGVDVGGSGIKAALVDVARGRLVSERRRVETPRSLQPREVLNALVGLVRSFEGRPPVGVGFPAVVADGRPLTGFTAHQVQSWIGCPVAERLARRLERKVVMLNDADAAGIAEMRFGRGRREQGVVVVLTLGTGIGSALFVDGRLVPNVELGSLYLRNRPKVGEWYASAEARERERLSLSRWTKRLDEYLRHVERLFSPRLIILGGGISKRADEFVPLLSVRAAVEPAQFRNQAGIIGAALVATGRAGA